MNDNTEHPRSHWEDTADSLLYADPDTAAQKLRETSFKGIEEYLAHQRINADTTVNQAIVDKFKSDNPGFMNNPGAIAASERYMSLAQEEDLLRAGLLDPKWFREQNGRDPTSHEIANWHKRARVTEPHRVRRFDELLDAAAERVEEDMPGVRRRIRSESENRKRAVADRQRATAQLQGKTLDEYRDEQLPSRMPSYSDGGEPVTGETVARSTLRGFGDGVPVAEDTARTARRSEAIAAMKNRTQGSDRRPGVGPQVQINRDRDSGRHADRQGAR